MPRRTSVFADLSARQIDGHLPEDAAFQLAEIREAQKDYKGAVAVYESLVLKKLAQPQLAWLRLGLAADLAGQPMRSVEALQRAYYDFPTTAEADQAGQALDKQDVDLEAPFAAKELARAETLFQARRWTGARQSYDRVKSFVAGDRSRSRPDQDRGHGDRARPPPRGPRRASPVSVGPARRGSRTSISLPRRAA